MSAPAGSRFIYAIDQDTGAEVERVCVDGWTELQITQLERSILAKSGDNILVKDSQFDEKN